MPNDALNHTPNGWPYLDATNYVDILDNYTEELATKLDTNLTPDAIGAATSAQGNKADTASQPGHKHTPTDIDGTLTPNQLATGTPTPNTLLHGAYTVWTDIGPA